MGFRLWDGDATVKYEENIYYLIKKLEPTPAQRLLITFDIFFFLLDICTRFMLPNSRKSDKPLAIPGAVGK